jgi:ATP-dependent Lon protease
VTDELYRPGRIIDEVALFPLPKLVFFPGTVLPLHIFEPRYRMMTEAVLAAPQRQIAVGMITGPEDPLDETARPEVATIVGIGEVVDHQRLSDGRFNLMVHGKARVKIEELPFVAPFRRVRATVLGSTNQDGGQTHLSALVSAATRFLTIATGGNASFEFEMPVHAEPSVTADLCAHQLIVDAAERQRVLEALDVGERVRRCAEALAIQQALLETDRVVH